MVQESAQGQTGTTQDVCDDSSFLQQRTCVFQNALALQQQIARLLDGRARVFRELLM